ncbi:hypothetical protein ABZS68_37980 [Streptomyces sp. NPDC005571]|uniref:hypothetical protein n=1 Tax=Streptomyces sp. NPDC005571 TaxID=3156888 RepID=UPI0033AF1B16
MIANGTRHGTVVVVQDVREVPEERQAVLNDTMNDRMRAVLHRVWGSMVRPLSSAARWP